MNKVVQPEIQNFVNNIFNEYIEKDTWEVKENSNCIFSFGGLNKHVLSKTTKIFWKGIYDKYDTKILEGHDEGDFHIHDLNSYSSYCFGASLEDVLRKGIRGIKNVAVSAPPKHLSSFTSQIANIATIYQNEVAGAVAFSSWNVYLAPFIYFDKIHRDEMLEEDGYEVEYSTKYAKAKKIKMKYNKRDMYDIKQSVQNLIFALNSNSRLGSEPVFSNFTLDFKVMKPMQQQPIIIAGKEHEFFTYGEFQEEANILIDVFAELMLKGDGIGKMHAYPVPTFNIGKNMDYEEPMYQKVFEMAAKDGTPYFGNFVNSTLDEDDIKAMCCRLQLDKRELRKKMGGLFGAGEKTGSIGVFTINLPAIAFRNKGKEKMHFFEDLKEKMLIGKKQLIIKKHTIVKEFEKGLYPALKEYLDNFNTMFMTIGFVGAHEMCRNYLDKGIETTEGRDFTIEVINFMKEQIADFQEETGELFNLEYTPAESAAYRMAKCDRHRYGSQIIQAGTNNKYYTNSTHLPVNIDWTYKQIYEHQNGLLDLATGGSVYHNYMKESTTAEMIKHFLKVSFENYKIPYISFSPLFSICEEHGFLKGLQKQCPHCNGKTTYYQRVTGYIREVENFNEGKLEEFKDRYQKNLSDIGEKAE